MRLLADSSDEETMQIIGEDIYITILPGTDPPVRGSTDSARWDCRANQSITLQPGQTMKGDLGLRLSIPNSYMMLLYSRSHLALEGITVERGVIDSDYRGPVQCILHNNNETLRRIT